MQAHYEDMLWGLPLEMAPYENPPTEMQESVTCDELWDQYLRLRKLVREVVSGSQTHPSVEPVYEVVLLTVRDDDGQIRRVRPKDRLLLGQGLGQGG